MRQQGFTLIELMIVVTIIAIIAALAIPSLTAARMSGNEASAISSLRVFHSTQEQYRTRFGVYAADLASLQFRGYIDSLFGSGQKAGYLFQNPTSTLNVAFSLEANPSDPGRTGVRHFYIDQTGVIRFATAGVATVGDAPLD